VAEPLQAVGAALGRDPLRFIMTGGEDFGLVATFPAGTELPAEWTVIGQVLDSGEVGAVTVDGEEYGDATGHRHFT
ncbi:MAG: thiamine-phosphate kinase, partial [Nocardioidaceae bacterium]